MTEIRFYHLQSMSLERALPQLLAKIYSMDMKIVVKFTSKERVQYFDNLLWTYAPDSFLPHSFGDDQNKEKQPIWLTDIDENPNGATILILADGANSDEISKYDICCKIFNGQNPEELKLARSCWQEYKNTGYKTTYYQQNDRGVWEKKL